MSWRRPRAREPLVANVMTARELFEILAREQGGMLSAYLRTQVRDGALAEDLFQETLLVAWRNLDRFDRTQPFGPWLRGIAGKLVLAARRRESRGFVPCDEQTLELLEARFARLEQRSGDTFDERIAGLRACLAALPALYREVVELRYREELSLEVLAGRAGVALETAKKRLQRGRGWLQECLRRRLAAEGGA